MAHDARSTPCRGILAALGLALAAAIVAVPGCNRSSGGAAQTGTTAAGPKDGARNDPKDVAMVRNAAAILWAARKADDWATTYGYETPEYLADASVEDYAKWKVENEPFSIKSYELGRVVTDGGLGWVEVKSDVVMRRYPGTGARTIERWEPWYRKDDRWLPVPSPLAESVPDTPVNRNAVEEARLRDRFMLAWKAREEKDARSLYEMTDPRQRAHVPFDQYVNAEFAQIYLDCAVKWTEVVNQPDGASDVGRVRVVIKFKPDDPSQEKADPTLAEVTDRWSKYDGEWYIDLGVQRKPLDEHDDHDGHDHAQGSVTNADGEEETR